tara:strand:+ start:83 stop:1822 length:1740 start_codon:yes stop_codon:yes gene_type:complete
MTNIGIYKRLWSTYTKHYVNKIAISIFFSILVAGSTSSIAWLLDPAIKKLFIEKDQSLIYLIPIAIILAFSIKGGSLYLAKSIMIKVGVEVANLIRMDCLKSIIKSDVEFMNKKHSGKFISHITFDIGLINTLVSTAVLNIFKDSLTLIGLLFVMFYQNWKLSLFAIVMIPLASFAARSLGKRITKISRELQDTVGALNTYLLEIFKNHKIIKIFQREQFEFSRANKILGDHREKTIKTNLVLTRMSPVMEVLTGIMIAALIYYSGTLIAKEQLGINNFFSFLAAMMLAYQPVRSLATLNLSINQGLSAARRVLPIIDEKSKIIEKAESKNFEITNGEIEFKDVSFKYEESIEKVLKSINLKIPGGHMTSLVGYSGAGKSTILNLIPRFYDASNGNIIIDGNLIYDLKIESLRSNISLVSQDITLFDDTIKNNIKYSKLDATEEEIIDAAKLSFCDEFVNKLPNKYDTLIGENGIRLSGGEKQRLSIARAMLKKSKIILLDEATSSLDADTEQKIQEAINLLTKNRTTLVIAHRLSTIMNSKKIYVVENGKIVAEGDHESLLKNSKTYLSFYNKQLRKV